jgi:hypothetical protein
MPVDLEQHPVTRTRNLVHAVPEDEATIVDRDFSVDVIDERPIEINEH